MTQQTAAKLYRAIVDNDPAGIASCLSSRVFVAIPDHEGEGPDHLTALVATLHTGGFRTWSDDSADVLASEHHGVVLDRWLRQTENLDEHVTVLAADLDDNGRFGIFSVYGYNNAAVAKFFD